MEAWSDKAGDCVGLTDWRCEQVGKVKLIRVCRERYNEIEVFIHMLEKYCGLELRVDDWKRA